MKRKIKFVHQLEANDCGPACLQMICAFYGKKYTLREIKKNLTVSKLGISIKDLRLFLKKNGFNCATVNITLDDIYEMPLPSILYLKHGHFIILENIGKKNIDIIDPGFGKVSLSLDSFREKWLNGSSGIAVVFEPSEDFKSIELISDKEEKQKSPIIANVKKILKKNRKKFYFSVLLTLITLVANWAMPILLKENIDKGILSKDMHIVLKLLLLQFIFAVSFLLSQSLSEVINTKISLELNIDFNKLYFLKILKLPISYHDSKFKSDLIEGLSDQHKINYFITYSLIGVATSILNIIVFSCLLIYQNYKIFLVFVLFSIISFSYILLFFKKKKQIDYSLFALESANRNTIYELIMGITDIKINSAEKSRLSNWMNSENKLKALKTRLAYINFYMNDGHLFISKIRDITLIGYTSYLVIESQITLGLMMMISYVLGQLSAPLQQLTDYTQNFQNTKLAHDRLTDIYNKENETKETGKYSNIESVNQITLKEVSFKYDINADQEVLKNINLVIKKNTTTAIVGESGSGKSTLLKLLLGFYYPTDGRIYIGNNCIQEINIKDWRQMCGAILQEGYIFSGSILENIAMSSENPDMEKLSLALKIAELYEKVESLPMKHYTKIGEIGVALSGGEKQRLLIARAIYKDPDFIFFDEATSSLDSINEKKIICNLNTYLKDRTSVIIAHRLSTIKSADQIIVLKNGEIVETGTHEELLYKQSEYSKLVSNQLQLST
ncbi:peptidase domain-containing ABC transporter [Chryseobacterium sp.]|uniref:peptidase domain-containing ABC transporter n=1 Tax=Chryseobacterium sp. TaxID=1871047 RepID=UPI001B2E8E6D|nr:peptidase domain-containing ABC transporter [Chryseobacterium sp.]MBO9693656.1 peptidase domain-containing ABC transporter [Chryseobacterium sp.]